MLLVVFVTSSMLYIFFMNIIILNLAEKNYLCYLEVRFMYYYKQQ